MTNVITSVHFSVYKAAFAWRAITAPLDTRHISVVEVYLVFGSNAFANTRSDFNFSQTSALGDHLYFNQRGTKRFVEIQL